jgi:hypothetical protein
MNSEKPAETNFLYSLVPLDDFKAVMGVDDREDKTARFCLVTSTLTIEQYCKRKFIHKKYFETVKLSDSPLVILKEYPVSEILAVSIFNGQIIEPEFYRPMLGNDYNEEMPFELLLSPSLKPYNLTAIKIIYTAGYERVSVPVDLSAACLELASWNFNRYKGRRVGMSGNIRGSGVQGEHFEMSIPENVKALIEPYRRKTI